MRESRMPTAPMAISRSRTGRARSPRRRPRRAQQRHGEIRSLRAARAMRAGARAVPRSSVRRLSPGGCARSSQLEIEPQPGLHVARLAKGFLENAASSVQSVRIDAVDVPGSPVRGADGAARNSRKWKASTIVSILRAARSAGCPRRAGARRYWSAPTCCERIDAGPRRRRGASPAT